MTLVGFYYYYYDIYDIYLNNIERSSMLQNLEKTLRLCEIVLHDPEASDNSKQEAQFWQKQIIERKKQLSPNQSNSS